MRDLDAFEIRFQNWVRWCKARGMHGNGRAASLEGAYSGPQGKGHPTGWGDWESGPLAPLNVPELIDIPDAVEVNRAFTQLAMIASTYAMAIKVLVFMDWMKPTRQAQILGTHYTRLSFMLDRAKKMLRNVLRGL